MEEYILEVKQLRKFGREQLNLNDIEMDALMEASLNYFDKISRRNKQAKFNKISNFKQILHKLLIVIVTSSLVYYLYTSFCSSSYSFMVKRKLTEVVYPAMALLRKMVIPILVAFPSITEWYDESCLIKNPFFHVTDIECWPCEHVRSILNLTEGNLSNEQYHLGIPFIARDLSMNKVTLTSLTKVYKRSSSVFNRDARKVLDNNGLRNTVEELFMTKSLHLNPTVNSDSNIIWRLNRLEPTIQIRSLFGKPIKVPRYASGPTPEKFVIIDEINSTKYELPTTEGTNIFLSVTTGSRLIILIPSPQCELSCHKVSILLKPRHILWFNWWYWRAWSVPVKNNGKLSITYMGSYY